MSIQHSDTRLKNGDEKVDEIVYFEDPDETDFGPTAKDLVLGDFADEAVLVEILVEGQFHEVVVQGD